VPLAAIALLTTWPWRLQDHAHWDAVEWIPFTQFVRPRDWVANIGLFVPLGVAYAWGGAGRRLAAQAAMAGLACSLAAELTQVFMHGRAPTVADLLANTTGAWLGARWALTRRRRSVESAAAPAAAAPAAARSPSN
jgi:glycopeptide antibiotics resistance protein